MDFLAYRTSTLIASAAMATHIQATAPSQANAKQTQTQQQSQPCAYHIFITKYKLHALLSQQHL
jgi:hypothetical protein